MSNDTFAFPEEPAEREANERDRAKPAQQELFG